MISYQTLLKNELLRRQRKNMAYSLRGFARDLGVSQPFLSQILNHKRQLSDDRAQMIAQKLKMARAQKEIFIQLVRLEKISNPQSRQGLKNDIERMLKRQGNFKLMEEDIFNVVADWHYFAILELSCLENFRSDASWIAKKLALPQKLIETSVARLIEMKLLIERDGRLVKVDQDYLFENVPSAAIRKHHHDSLDLAHKALDQQDMAEREFFAVSFPLDPHLIPEIKERIREFSEGLMAEYQNSRPLSVYKLAVQFFRLDQENV